MNSHPISTALQFPTPAVRDSPAALAHRLRCVRGGAVVAMINGQRKS